jgi:hypothetical protein
VVPGDPWLPSIDFDFLDSDGNGHSLGDFRGASPVLLVIGREHAKDSLDAHAAAKGKALGDIYENFRVISTRHLSVAGVPAVEQRSRGSADGRDWSVILLTLFKGGDAYTLLGMTYADSDLIQVQENVIAKAINSLTFTTP